MKYEEFIGWNSLVSYDECQKKRQHKNSQISNKQQKMIFSMNNVHRPVSYTKFSKNGTLWYSRAMKVLILITKSNWGGAQRYVYDLATNLPKSEYQVEVMAGGNGPMIQRLKEAGIEADGNLPVGRDINIFEDIKVFFKIISILHQKRPDILHVNSSKIGVIGTLAGRLVGIKKIIFTSHGWAFNEDRSIVSRMIFSFFHWITVVLSHKTITVSEKLKNQMINWPFIGDKIEVVHNGIKNQPIFSKIHARDELVKINPIFAEQIKKYNPKELIVLGSIGELHKTKGYEYAIQGVTEFINKLNKKVIYAIIGNGQEEKNLQKLIVEKKMENHIILCDYVPEALQYMRAFDIFIISSISEGLPYVMLEAGLATLPVISTAVGGIPEIVDDMKSGILIQSKKAREISHSIDFFLSHKKVQKQYATTLHQKVVNEFSIEKMILETLQVYNS